MRPKGRKSDFWNFEYPAYRIQHPDEAEFFGIDPPTGLSPNTFMNQPNESTMLSPNSSMIVPEFTPLLMTKNPKSMKSKNKSGKNRSKKAGIPMMNGHHHGGDGLRNPYNYNQQMAQMKMQMINGRGGHPQFQQQQQQYPSVEEQMVRYQQQMYHHYYHISQDPSSRYTPTRPHVVEETSHESYGHHHHQNDGNPDQNCVEMAVQTSGVVKSMVYPSGPGQVDENGNGVVIDLSKLSTTSTLSPTGRRNSTSQQGDSGSGQKIELQIQDIKGKLNENVIVEGGNAGDGVVNSDDIKKGSPVVVCELAMRNYDKSKNGGDSYMFASRGRDSSGGKNFHSSDGILEVLRNEKPVSSADKVMAWCPGGQSEVKNWSPYQGYMDTEISEREMGSSEVESGKSVNYSEQVSEMHQIASNQMTHRHPGYGFGTNNNMMNYGRNTLAFRPPWDNNIRDLNRLKLHPFQLAQRKFERISKNLPKAREELIKNGIKNESKFKEKISCLKKSKISPESLMDSSKGSPQGVNPSPHLLAFLEHHHLP